MRHMFTGASVGVRTLMLRFHCHGIKTDLVYVDYNSDSFEPSSAHYTWDLNLTEWLIHDFTFPRNAAVERANTILKALSFPLRYSSSQTPFHKTCLPCSGCLLKVFACNNFGRFSPKAPISTFCSTFSPLRLNKLLTYSFSSPTNAYLCMQKYRLFLQST